MSDTMYPSLDDQELLSGEGTNGYANLPEKVEGVEVMPSVESLLGIKKQPLLKAATPAALALPHSFEQFCKKHGGFLKLFNEIADPSSDWEQYGMFYDKDEQAGFDALSSAEQDKVLQRRAYEEWEDRYNQMRWEHSSWSWPLKVWRSITLKDIQQLKTKGVGIYWAYEDSAAEAHWGHPGSEGTYTLEAQITENAVDWDSTIFANLQPSIGDMEKEITLKEGAPVKLLRWQDPTDKWHNALAEWKRVTAGAGDRNAYVPREDTEAPALHTEPLFPEEDKTAAAGQLDFPGMGAPDYEMAEHEIIEMVASDILREYAQHYKDLNYRQDWDVVPAARLIKIWNDYAKTGFVRDERGLDQIEDIILTNIAKLHVNTILCGHDSEDNVAFAEGVLGEDLPEDYFDNDGSFFEDEKGAWRLSDYALKPLEADAAKLRRGATAEQRLQIIDHILNIIHARSDLSSWFVEGGRATLNRLAGK